MSAKRIDKTNQLYLSGALILAAMIGFVILEALVWGALWVWNGDFRRLLGENYVKWVMAGLGAAAVWQYWGSRVIDLPLGFTTGALVALGVWLGMDRRLRR
jgi:hypothetical protein